MNHGKLPFYGTTEKSINFVKDNGACKGKLWMYYPVHKEDEKPSEEAQNDAPNQKILGFFRLEPYNVSDPNKTDLLIDCLRQDAPIPINISIGVNKSFDAYKAKETVTSGVGPYRGRHAVVCMGYHTHRDYGDGTKGPAFKIRNSWGSAWGEGGYVWISKNALEQMLTDRQPIIINGAKGEGKKEPKEPEKPKKTSAELLNGIIERKKEVITKIGNVEKIKQSLLKETKALSEEISGKIQNEKDITLYLEETSPHLMDRTDKRYEKADEELSVTERLTKSEIILENLLKELYQIEFELNQAIRLLLNEQTNEEIKAIITNLDKIGREIVASLSTYFRESKQELLNESKLKNILDKKHLTDRVKRTWIFTKKWLEDGTVRLFNYQLMSYRKLSEKIKQEIEVTQQLISLLEPKKSPQPYEGPHGTYEGPEPTPELPEPEEEEHYKDYSPEETKCLVPLLKENFGGTKFKLFYPGAFKGIDHVFRLSESDEIVLVDPQFSSSEYSNLNYEIDFLKTISKTQLEIKGKLPLKPKSKVELFYTFNGQQKKVIVIADDALNDLEDLKKYDVLHYAHAPTAPYGIKKLSDENNKIKLLNKLRIGGITIHVLLPLALGPYFEEIGSYMWPNSWGNGLPPTKEIIYRKIKDFELKVSEPPLEELKYEKTEEIEVEGKKKIAKISVKFDEKCYPNSQAVINEIIKVGRRYGKGSDEISVHPMFPKKTNKYHTEVEFIINEYLGLCTNSALKAVDKLKIFLLEGINQLKVNILFTNIDANISENWEERIYFKYEGGVSQKDKILIRCDVFGFFYFGFIHTLFPLGVSKEQYLYQALIHELSHHLSEDAIKENELQIMNEEQRALEVYNINRQEGVKLYNKYLLNLTLFKIRSEGLTTFNDLTERQLMHPLSVGLFLSIAPLFERITSYGSIKEIEDTFLKYELLDKHSYYLGSMMYLIIGFAKLYSKGKESEVKILAAKGVETPEDFIDKCSILELGELSKLVYPVDPKLIISFVSKEWTTNKSTTNPFMPEDIRNEVISEGRKLDILDFIKEYEKAVTN